MSASLLEEITVFGRPSVAKRMTVAMKSLGHVPSAAVFAATTNAALHDGCPDAWAMVALRAAAAAPAAPTPVVLRLSCPSVLLFVGSLFIVLLFSCPRVIFPPCHLVSLVNCYLVLLYF